MTRLVDRAAAHAQVPARRCSSTGRSAPWSATTTAPDLLAVLGEALSNAARHAEATAVSVSLSAGDSITLIVRDDGRGLPQDANESGLANLRQRAERLGGGAPSPRPPVTGRRWSGRCPPRRRRAEAAQMKSSWAPSVFSMKSVALMMPSTPS